MLKYYKRQAKSLPKTESHISIKMEAKKIVRMYSTLFTSFPLFWKKKMIDKYPKNGISTIRKYIEISLN